jgi:hypothetical protein
MSWLIRQPVPSSEVSVDAGQNTQLHYNNLRDSRQICQSIRIELMLIDQQMNTKLFARIAS